MANCLTCIHQEVCRERMAIFNLPNIACQYEAHELHGEWIDYQDAEYSYLANCSKCGYQMNTHEEHGYFNFCPNCGASMVKEGDEE